MARGRRIIRRWRAPPGALQRARPPPYKQGLKAVTSSVSRRPHRGPRRAGLLPRRGRKMNHTHAALGFLVGLNFLLILMLASRQPLVIEQGGGGRSTTVVGGGGGGGEPGVDGYSALVVTSDEPLGPNCDPEGLQVDSGLDDGSGGGIARDEILQPGEVQLTSYVCDGADGAAGAAGADGFNSLVKTTTESPGANCPTGGKKVDSGLDNGDGGGIARNGVLEAGEVDAFTYVCNGAAGSNGADGFNSLVKTTAESPGVNCPAGGRKVESGLDNGDGGGTARNGILEAGEVDATTYVCDGAAGAAGTDGRNALVTSTAEAAGANCANAGIKITAGTDNGDGGGTAGDGILQAGEVDTTGYACNGAPAGLLYTYNTGTSGDPGSGKFGFDTTTLTAIATLRISETDGDGNAISALIATWDDSTSSVRSTITVLGSGVPTRMLVFSITGAITDNGAYDSFAVAYVTHAGSHANNDIDRIAQSRTGDKGDTGSAGSNGNGFTVVDALTSAFTSTSTTGAEVTGLTNTLSSTGTYVFTYYLICDVAATTTGIDFGVNFDSTQTIIVLGMRYQDNGASASAGIADGTLGGDAAEGIVAGGSSLSETTTAPNLNVLTGAASANEDFIVIIEGIIITTASGELELWAASDVASSEIDIGTGSSVTIIKTG